MPMALLGSVFLPFLCDLRDRTISVVARGFNFARAENPTKSLLPLLTSSTLPPSLSLPLSAELPSVFQTILTELLDS